ncbi:MAG: hypothetical protein AAGC77_05490 [Pseudomonadota bacterium]
MKDKLLSKMLQAVKARARASERDLAEVRQREAALLAEAQSMADKAQRAALDSAGAESAAELKQLHRYGQSVLRLAEQRKADATKLEGPLEERRAKLLTAIRHETAIGQLESRARARKQRKLNEFEERSLEELNRLKAQ